MISKEQFDKVYNNHLPNGFIKLIFKYFSKETERKDMIVGIIINYILLSLFFVGFFFTAFRGSRKVIGTVTLIYTGILTVLSLSMLVAAKWNNFRLKRIAKELGIDKEEYEFYNNMYYGKK